MRRLTDELDSTLLKGRVFLSNSGFSLIEMMVVCGLMLVSSLALIQLTTNMNRSNNAIQYRSDADTLNEEISPDISSESRHLNFSAESILS